MEVSLGNPTRTCTYKRSASAPVRSIYVPSRLFRLLAIYTQPTDAKGAKNQLLDLLTGK
jgi:hypothetical protein